MSEEELIRRPTAGVFLKPISKEDFQKKQNKIGANIQLSKPLELNKTKMKAVERSIEDFNETFINQQKKKIIETIIRLRILEFYKPLFEKMLELVELFKTINESNKSDVSKKKYIYDLKMDINTVYFMLKTQLEYSIHNIIQSEYPDTNYANFGITVNKGKYEINVLPVFEIPLKAIVDIHKRINQLMYDNNTDNYHTWIDIRRVPNTKIFNLFPYKILYQRIDKLSKQLFDSQLYLSRSGSVVVAPNAEVAPNVEVVSGSSDVVSGSAEGVSGASDVVSDPNVEVVSGSSDVVSDPNAEGVSDPNAEGVSGSSEGVSGSSDVFSDSDSGPILQLGTNLIHSKHVNVPQENSEIAVLKTTIKEIQEKIEKISQNLKDTSFDPLKIIDQLENLHTEKENVSSENNEIDELEETIKKIKTKIEKIEKNLEDTSFKSSIDQPEKSVIKSEIYSQISQERSKWNECYLQEFEINEKGELIATNLYTFIHDENYFIRKIIDLLNDNIPTYTNQVNCCIFERINNDNIFNYNSEANGEILFKLIIFDTLYFY